MADVTLICDGLNMNYMYPMGSCALTLGSPVWGGCTIPEKVVLVRRRRPPRVTLECLPQLCFWSDSLCILYTKVWTSHVLWARRCRPSYVSHKHAALGTKLWAQVNISLHSCFCRDFVMARRNVVGLEGCFCAMYLELHVSNCVYLSVHVFVHTC